MRPLFAIAPLAVVLALIGPTPHEANQVLTALKAKFLPDAPSSKTELPVQQVGILRK